MPGAQRSIVVKADPKRCYQIITDFESYPQFNDEMKRVRVLSKGANTWDVEFTVNIIKDIVYSVRVTGTEFTAVSWKLISGWFKSNDGGWTLTDNKDGTTRIDYRVDLGLGPLVPKKIVDTLISTSFPAMLERFKQRMERGA